MVIFALCEHGSARFYVFFSWELSSPSKFGSVDDILNSFASSNNFDILLSSECIEHATVFLNSSSTCASHPSTVQLNCFLTLSSIFINAMNTMAMALCICWVIKIKCQVPTWFDQLHFLNIYIVIVGVCDVRCAVRRGSDAVATAVWIQIGVATRRTCISHHRTGASFSFSFFIYLFIKPDKFL